MATWKRKFAILPTRVGGLIVWLKNYETKLVRVPGGYKEYVRVRDGYMERCVAFIDTSDPARPAKIWW